MPRIVQKKRERPQSSIPIESKKPKTNSEVYVVEKIIQIDGPKYLCRWKGYLPSDDTWEMQDMFEDQEGLTILIDNFNEQEALDFSIDNFNDHTSTDDETDEFALVFKNHDVQLPADTDLEDTLDDLLTEKRSNYLPTDTDLEDTLEEEDYDDLGTGNRDDYLSADTDWEAVLVEEEEEEESDETTGLDLSIEKNDNAKKKFRFLPWCLKCRKSIQSHHKEDESEIGLKRRLEMLEKEIGEVRVKYYTVMISQKQIF